MNGFQVYWTSLIPLKFIHCVAGHQLKKQIISRGTHKLFALLQSFHKGEKKLKAQKRKKEAESEDEAESASEAEAEASEAAEPSRKKKAKVAAAKSKTIKSETKQSRALKQQTSLTNFFKVSKWRTSINRYPLQSIKISVVSTGKNGRVTLASSSL